MKHLKVLTVLAILFFLSGCWDYMEYDNIAQVVGIAIDYDKQSGQVTMAHQYVIPKAGKGSDSSGSSSGKTGLVNAATDKTRFEAYSKLQQVIMKRIFYGYLRVVVMGEEAAKYNLLDELELMDRTPTIRDTAYFAVCTGKAEKVLSTVNESSMIPSSQIIYGLLNNSQATGAAFPVTIHDITEMLAIGGWEATAPRIIAVASDEGKLQTAGNEDNIRLAEKNKGAFRVAGMAAFKQGKLVGWLNEKETRGFGFITGKKLTAFTVSDKPAGTDTTDILYFRILKSSGKIKPELVNNEPVISVEVSATADLRKYYSKKGYDYLNPAEIKIAENELAKSIRSDIQAALLKGQNQLQSDIFGFGFAFFRKYPALWKSDYKKIWPEIYPDIPVKVTVKARIINTGSNNRKLIIK